MVCRLLVKDRVELMVIDVTSEIDLVMGYFALVDSCQSTNNQSIQFAMNDMPIIEKTIRENLQYDTSKLMFNKLSELHFKDFKDKELKLKWK